MRGWLRICFLLLLGLPGTGKTQDSPQTIAEAYIHERLHDNVTIELRRSYISAHNGLTHFYYQQLVDGVPLTDRDICLHIDKANQVIQAHGIVEALHRGPARRSKMLSAQVAKERAAAHLSTPVPDDVIPVQKQFYVSADATTRLVWNMNFELPDGSHWWELNVDAYSGDIVAVSDWTHHCQYHVWDLPIASPDHGPRSLITAMIDTNASPFGWHDTDGVAGADLFDTRGNNVQAQEDRDADNLFGHRPIAGTNLVFDATYQPNLAPHQNEDTAIAHTFYINNLIHDIHYQYGFTEAAGNFQQNNYGKGGLGNDPVIADVQDGTSFNNASFSSVPDGISGRMQLHLWQGFYLSIDIASPAAIAGSYTGSGATFGNAFPTNGLSGQLVAALDPPDAPQNSITDGCSAITNAAALVGHFAFIDRGDCFFIEKVKHAQDAGAIAVVIANHLSDQLVSMSGTDPTITIPSVFVSKSDGDAIRAQLNAEEEIQLTVTSTPRRDSSLDSSIIVHEYGHGVSIRLTGGPANANCLSGLQSNAMGEGWSDWWALVFTHEPGDTRTTPRGIGTYVAGQSTAGRGIRSFAYSTDMNDNALSYGSLVFRTGEHAIGEIWCVTLWELYWDLIDRYGYDPNIYTGRGGNNLAMQLVMDGLKLQPCSPTFLDGRDAILLADRVNNQGNNQCLIWNAFARRGMGALAGDGGSHNSDAVSPDFSVPRGCEQELLVAQVTPEISLGQIMLDWPSVSGAVYQVEENSGLIDTNWSPVSGVITAALSSTQFSITNAAADQRHYRIRLFLEQ